MAYVLTCDKESVYLSRDKPNHMYLIEFKAVNETIRVDGLLTFDIYKMLYELNKDMFDSYHIVYPDPEDPSRAELLFVFKSIMGLGERYTHVNAHMQKDGQVVCIKSSDIMKTDPSLLQHLIPKRADQLDSDNSNITIHVQPDGHAIQFYYNFKLQLSKPGDVITIPPFVDKAVSKMMKTMFVRMKKFIECLG